MKCLLVALLPVLCSALTGNHVTVSIGGSTYQHGVKVDHPAQIQTPAYSAPAPVHHAPPPAVYHTPTTYHTQAPVYPTAAPVYPKPATYHTTAPVYHTPTAVYHKPATVYHKQATVYPKPATVYHKPVTVYHKPATVYHQPTPQYHTPKQNCSVVDEVIKAKVCTPAFETKCTTVDVTVKAIVDKEQCQDITRTVCTTADEVIENNICVYSYEKQSEKTVATTVAVTYAKECTNQKVTVCQPSQGYSHQSYGQQYCKEDYQKTCYNVPKVTPVEKKVSVVFPSPVKSCSDKPITIPRVSCEDLIENKCITVPDVKDEIKKVEKCEVSLAEPSCQEVSLTLPKQVCTDLVYGHAQELTAHQYHAKVL